VIGNAAYAYVRDVYVLTAIGATVLSLATINFAQFFAHVREELGRAEHGETDAPFLMGVLRACYALAWTVGPPLGAKILARFGYQGVFLSTAALYVVFACAVHRFVAHRPRAVPPAVADQSAGARPSRVASWGLREPVLWAYALAFGLVFAGFTLKALNLPLFLTETLGTTEQAVGLAFAVSPIFELAFMVGFGHLAAKGARHERAVICCGVLSAVVHFLALRSVSAAWQVYPLQVLNAAAVAVATSVAIPFFQDLMPQRAGTATSLYSNALKLGSLLGFITFGTLARALGHTGLFSICAGLSAVSLGIMVLVRPPALRRAHG
jgi:SET family sugar efflux transporter-like MFS transporter